MDKYEYQVCADQIKSLIKERRFTEAMDIADTIDWRRVKSFSMLCTVSEIYKVTKHYSEARDILLLAYERYPDRANVVYALCELAIKLDDISESVEYYKEYVRLKPHDTNRYVLLYKIYEAQDVPLEEKISLLEEFKRAEYTEKWSYELALLYHKDGQETKCVETCDELIIWFGDGPYVRKALELKMQHAPLTKEQQRKYDGVYDAPAIPKNDGEETVHIYETQSLNAYANGASPFETAPIESPAAPSSSVAAPQQPSYSQPADTYADIQVKPVGTDKYSTISLQEDLAKSMQEFYAREQGEVPAPYYGTTTQLYEPSQEQFMAQINQAGTILTTTGEMPVTNTMYNQPSQPADTSYYNQPQQNQAYYEQQEILKPAGSMYEQSLQPQYGQPVQSQYDQMYGQMQPQYAQPADMAYYNQPQQNQEYYGQPEVQQPIQVQYEQPIQQSVEPTYEQPVQSQYNQPASSQEPVPAPLPVYDSSVSQKPVSEPVKQSEEPDITPKMTTSQLPVYQEPNTVYAAPNPSVSHPSVPVIAPSQPSQRVPKDMEDKLREGLDGQVTMALPDAAEIERQITGQIDISDFMDDWNAKKKSAEEQRKAQLMARSMEQTSDIMSQLVGVIPGIDSVADTKKPSEPKKESVIAEEVISEDEKGVVTKTTLSSPTFDRETNIKRTESGAKINGPLKSSITGEIPDILPNALSGDIEPEEEITIPEEVKVPEVRTEAVAEEVRTEESISPEAKRGDSEESSDISADAVEEASEAVSEEITEEVSELVTEEASEELVEESGEEADIVSNPGVTIVEAKGDILPSGRKLTLDEEYGGNIAKIRREDEELVKRLTGELPPVEEEPLEPVAETPMDYGVTEDIEDVEQPDVVFEDEEASEDEYEPKLPANTAEIPPLPTKEEVAAFEVEEPVYSTGEAEVQEEEPEETEEAEVVEEEPITYPYQVDELGEVEDLVDIDQPDDVDDMLKTRPIPIAEIEAQQRYEAGIEDEEIPVEAEKKPNVPSYAQRDRFVRSRREFDDAEIEIFGRFEGIEPLKAQIVDAIDDMSMESSHGNVVVTGSELFDRKALAIDIVKAIQMMDSSFSGKVAKISGEALNKKDIPVTMSKLREGALIVENASGLTPVTINAITETLLTQDEEILVVFEGDRETLEPLLNGCEETRTVFNARINMEDFNDEDLVAYGKGYARELGYSIDEMGSLALHTRIAEMQSLDHKVSVDEVMDLIDAAIRHVDRKNVGHFMDVLLAKRYDDDDYIVLREKDFVY